MLFTVVILEGERPLTDNGECQSIAKGRHFIICTPSIDLKDGKAYELCQQGSPETPAVSVHLAVQSCSHSDPSEAFKRPMAS